MGQEPDAIRDEIEETRARMTETVDALGYKADVKSRAKDRVTGVKDRIVGAAPDTDEVKDGAQQAVSVAQETPIGRAVGAAAGAEIDLPEGSFYAWWRLPEGLTPERLIAEARVGVAPGEGFGARGAGWARLSLATPDADIDEAAARLAAVLSS